MSMSPYKSETSKSSAILLNNNFIKKIENGEKTAAEHASSAFIRSRLREESFARQILNPTMLSDGEFDRDVNTDMPRKIIEIEPDSTATYVNFKGGGKRSWFRGPRYEVRFGKIESPRFTKSKFELMTYQNDIRKILTDNSVKDMADQEDARFYTTCASIISTFPGQALNPGGGLTAANFVSGLQNLISRKIPIGKVLMCEELYYDALKLPATSVGDQVASRHYTDGLRDEKNLWGVPVVTTIKNDILPSNEIWFFGPENYLGNFFLIQDATLFIEQKADIIEFFSYEALGIGIGNCASMTRLRL